MLFKKFSFEKMLLKMPYNSSLSKSNFDASYNSMCMLRYTKSLDERVHTMQTSYRSASLHGVKLDPKKHCLFVHLSFMMIENDRGYVTCMGQVN